MGDEKEDKLGLSEAELTEVQKKTLDDLLRNYQDILRDEPGLAKGVHHVIETGDSLPKWTMPYRICPAWRDTIKKEISTLLEAGIIEPTTSPHGHLQLFLSRNLMDLFVSALTSGS